jgi:hypothetical protein
MTWILDYTWMMRPCLHGLPAGFRGSRDEPSGHDDDLAKGELDLEAQIDFESKS